MSYDILIYTAAAAAVSKQKNSMACLGAFERPDDLLLHADVGRPRPLSGILVVNGLDKCKKETKRQKDLKKKKGDKATD